ncbi:MAG: metal-dependent hydrolase [Thermoplasmata archaeon]|nr:metal-dependent hydrolase [Thermoplasmata archaeon]
MDLFTHVLLAYLLTFGLVGANPAYLAAGALAGGLPDADALFFPIAGRFPILRHHGITHSLFGVTVVALAGALVAPILAPGAPLVYFLVMEAGGIAHVLGDGFTHFSVPPLLPFSEVKLELDADRAINFLTLAVSVGSFYLLLGVERNHVPFAWYVATVYGLMAFYGAYIGIRLAGRYFITRHRGALAPDAVPIPTGNPFRWLLLSERRDGTTVRTTWARYQLGRGLVAGPFTVEGSLTLGTHSTTPHTAVEALDWSYALARKASRMMEMTYHFGEAFERPGGDWEAVWYSLEFTAFGRSQAVRVRFPAGGGEPLVKTAFYRPVQTTV